MYLWIVILGGFVSFYNSWGVGANDCEFFCNFCWCKNFNIKAGINNSRNI